MESFRDKVVIVTGASSGIGAETAAQFASKGAKVTITDQNEERLNETLQMCLSAGATDQDILIVHGDIMTNDVIKSIVDKTVDKFGQLNILVNNAGTGSLCSLSEADEDNLLSVYKLNALSAVLLTQSAMPHLLKTKGCLVNTSSIGGSQPFPNLLAYSMSKAALDMFTKCAALQYADKGVRVNAVSPGCIETPIFATAGFCENKPEALQKLFKFMGQSHPMKRTGLAHEVAATILYLTSDQASFTTGVILPVDGGRLCWMQGVDKWPIKYANSKRAVIAKDTLCNTPHCT